MFELVPTIVPNRLHNRRLKQKYDKDPRTFWSDKSHNSSLDPCLNEFAGFTHSIRVAAANCERQFSRMGWMISQRRAKITAPNSNKRLTMMNQLPQKRRLEQLCEEREIKRIKLSESLFIPA